MALLRRHRTSRETYDLHYGPNMTPMVDVVMVILVFFMASAAILGPTWFLRAALPPAPKDAATTPAKDDLLRMRISIERSPEGTVFVRWTEAKGDAAPQPSPKAFATIAELKQRLNDLVRQHQSWRMVVLIDPRPNVPMQDVVTVHAACQALGIEKVGLASAAEKIGE
ncbi:MAG: biopolymer transporter ExbD [Planctomycetes bacterium]|nr:biopolymer transporter ExbD [Planctomycetota bacterium]